jgi:hypothetical protein
MEPFVTRSQETNNEINIISESQEEMLLLTLEVLDNEAL